MRKLIKIALVALGIRAFLRWRKRRKAEQELEDGTAKSPPDPADQLRQKLAESRAEDGSLEAEAETPSPTASVDERRAEVHAQGRTTVDEMTPSDEA